MANNTTGRTTKPKQASKQSQGANSSKAKDKPIKDTTVMAKPEAVKIKWYNDDGVYRSEDDRFTIMRASANYHSGEWEMYDSKTKRTYYEWSLKDCKYIAETYCVRRD